MEPSDWAGIIQSFDIPVVVDHMGRPSPASVDPSSVAIAQLITFVQEGRCCVKLSAPYRLSGNTTRLARAFLEANASGCCWGTDWPHVDTTHPVDTRNVVARSTTGSAIGGRVVRSRAELAARLFGN
jgi:predicted TIM-barrel fold metal-dependent hydrolase